MKRILWIEDEANTYFNQYKTPLVRARYSIDIAIDATEAVALMDKKKYDILIVDIIISAGRGFKSDEKNYVGLELLNKIISDNIYPPNRIMVFSAVNDPDVDAAIQELGVPNILHKSAVDNTSEFKRSVEEVFFNIEQPGEG